jgi:hypothetical protein
MPLFKKTFTAIFKVLIKITKKKNANSITFWFIILYKKYLFSILIFEMYLYWFFKILILQKIDRKNNKEITFQFYLFIKISEFSSIRVEG